MTIVGRRDADNGHGARLKKGFQIHRSLFK
jgi:hypothetical protein